MNKNSKVGFTVVELLAVIVVLAVVILIAIAAIIPRMDKAKRNSLLIEGNVYLKAASQSYAFDNDMPASGKVCTTIEELNSEYVVKNNNNYRGTVITDYINDEMVQMISLTDGKYYLRGSGVLSLDNIKEEQDDLFLLTCDDYENKLFKTNSLAYRLIYNQSYQSIAKSFEVIDARSSNVNFKEVETLGSRSGLYKGFDDDGISYYYRGNVNNNWVKFGGFLWRIIRINGDGSIRMMYSGTPSSYSGSNTMINTRQGKNIKFQPNTKYNVLTTDVSGLTSNNITTTFNNQTEVSTYAAYMYNPVKKIVSYPTFALDGTNINLMQYPYRSDMNSSYYIFKNFDPQTDCEVGSATNDNSHCTLTCRSLGDDCIKATMSELASNTNNLSDSLPGAISGTKSNGTSYNYKVYTGDYKYTCWSDQTPVTRSNSDSTTSVYISCALVNEIVGLNTNDLSKPVVKFHGPAFTDPLDSKKNVKDSLAKAETDYWYENNILNATDGNGHKLEEYIVDEVFCSDRSSDATTFPVSTEQTYLFGSFLRTSYSESVKPLFRCPDLKHDGFTLGSNSLSTVAKSNKGNGALKYPVGLITMDEVVMAGGVYAKSNTSYYLYNGASYWTMSPHWYIPSLNGVSTGMVENGMLNSALTNGMWASMGIRPVINLSKDVLYNSGSGGSSNPYTVKLP